MIILFNIDYFRKKLAISIIIIITNFIINQEVIINSKNNIIKFSFKEHKYFNIKDIDFIMINIKIVEIIITIIIMSIEMVVNFIVIIERIIN